MSLSAETPFSFSQDASVTSIDPKKVVNSFCTRPVLNRNIKVLSSSIELNGCQSSKFVSGRIATYPEICNFYTQDPFSYSEEKAREIASTAMKDEEAGGHTYLYDGHLRKYAVLELMKSKKLKLSFRLPCLLGRYLNDEEEIAFSISCNAVNEFAVPLSPLTLLMRCHAFDEAANSSRSKRLSATDVAKRMVQFSSSDMLASSAKAKLAETRRQYLSISRRLQSPTVEFFNILLETDEAGLERAFNVSNLKAI